MRRDGGSVRAWIAAVVVVLAMLFGAAYFFFAPPSRKPLDDYVAALKAAGKPVTVVDALGPPPPPETNGIVDFESACRWLDEHAGPQEKWTYAGPWSANWTATWYDDEPPERLAALDRFLASLQPYWDGLDAAVAKPNFLAASARDANGVVVQSGLSRLPRTMNVVQARALVASRADDRLDAMAWLLAMSARIDRRSGMAQIVAPVASRMAVAALRRDVERGRLDVFAARKRLDPLLVEPWLSRVRDHVVFQRVQMLDAATNVYWKRDAGRSELSSSVLEASKRIERAIRGQPEPRETEARGTPKQFAEVHAAFAPLESLPTDSYPRMAREAHAFDDATKNSPFMRAWMPASRGVLETFARAEATARLARVALAVAEFRATHGDFPASLDETASMFADGVPIDPYTDAPFVYARTAAGARIASLGRLSADEPLADTALRARCLVWELKR